ncbi:MAG: methyltransferase domain-containing protein [archaeon]
MKSAPLSFLGFKKLILGSKESPDDLLMSEALKSVEKANYGGKKLPAELASRCPFLSPEKRVLQLFCGSGETVCYIAWKYGARVVGTTEIMRMAAPSKKAARKLELQCRFMRADSEKGMRLKKGSADVVISFRTPKAQHNMDGLLAEVLQVLAAEGICLWVTATDGEQKRLELAAARNGARALHVWHGEYAAGRQGMVYWINYLVR